MLTSEELKALQQCTQKLLAWNGDVTVEEHLLRSLEGLMEARVLAYQHFDFRKGTSKLILSHHELDIQTHEEAFYSHLHEHPLIQATKADGTLPASRISDLVSREAFERTGIYNEFYRQIGFSHQLAISLPTRRGDVIGLVYSRDSDFTASEKELLDLARASVLHVYRQSKRFNSLLRKIQTLNGMLETMDQGLIALTPALRIRQTTSRTENLLSKHFPGSAMTGKKTTRAQLPSALAEWIEHVIGAESLPEDAFRYTFDTGVGLLKCRLCPMPKGWLLQVEEQPARPSPDSYRRLGLTGRESEILWFLADGKTNLQIATLLGSRPRTIEKHVEHILVKLHVDSRGAAVAKAHQLI